MNLTLKKPSVPNFVQAISSKSDAHRLLICAALADRQTRLYCPDLNADIEATARVLRALGATITYKDSFFTIDPINIPPQEEVVLDCGESGSTLRFILPVAAALGVTARLVGKGRLLSRPMHPLTNCLCAHGVQINQQEDAIFLSGKLSSGVYEIAGNVSSQYITGLLLALPLLQEASTIHLTTRLESAPYVDITLDAQRRFGVEIEKKQAEYTVLPRKYISPDIVYAQGDWSNAAFWLAAGAIGSHPVTVAGLDRNSMQGDREICSILTRFGAAVEWNTDQVTVSPNTCHAVEIDAQDIPDLVPILSVIAACADGTTKITGVARLRIKESDRIETVCALLRALGITVNAEDNCITITGGKICGGIVDGANDHRIVMSAAIAASVCPEEITIHGAEAVNKSYPGFFDILGK